MIKHIFNHTFNCHQFRIFISDHYAAHAGCGLSKLHPAVALNSLRADSEFNISLPAAGETRLKALRKAESKRQRDKCMDELKTVLERVRLALDEFNTAQAELEVPESPDLEYEAEEEEKRQRKKKLKRKRRREQRKIRHKKASSKETLKGREKNAEEKSAKSEKESGSSSDEGDEDSGEEQEKNAEENSAESDEESGSSSDVGDEDSGEDEDNDEDQGAEEEDRQGENWTMTGQIKRKVSQRMLVKVGIVIRYYSNQSVKIHSKEDSSLHGLICGPGSTQGPKVKRANQMYVLCRYFQRSRSYHASFVTLSYMNNCVGQGIMEKLI